jgi:glycopeptide antibiotics resistance protein
VHTRIAELKRVPFEAYCFGTELRAVTEVFHKTGFFFPIGAILAVGVAGIRRRWAVSPALLHAASVLIMAGVAAGIEIGQVFLPTKVADTTDWFLETLGGVLGYVCLRMLLPLWQPGANAVSRPTASGTKWT